MILEIEQVRNPATELIESPRNKDSLKILDLLKNEKYVNYLIYFYKVFFHIFIFSVFESFFFWFYVTDQEDAALKNQFKQLNMLSNLICSNVDIDLDPFYEYLSEQRIQYNNDVPIIKTPTVIIHTFLPSIYYYFLFFLFAIFIFNSNSPGKLSTFSGSGFLPLIISSYGLSKSI